MLYKIDTSST